MPQSDESIQDSCIIAINVGNKCGRNITSELDDRVEDLEARGPRSLPLAALIPIVCFLIAACPSFLK